VNATLAGTKSPPRTERTSSAPAILAASIFLGGWPGALVAQSVLRHKSRNQPFRIIFWLTVILNCAAIAWLSTPEGGVAFRSFPGPF
jgi:uncharacterized membrane protein YsdA (DUF1294 family)